MKTFQCRTTILALAIVGACCLALAVPTRADRAMVHIDTSLGFPRLLTDTGTPIRAMSLSWDAGEPRAVLPTQDQVNRLASTYGVNAIRVFLECHMQKNIGVNAKSCDTLIDECSKAGLYVIFTIGGCERGYDVNTQPDSEWTYAKAFWTFYAPRYASRSNVVYELHNEPGPWFNRRWSDHDYDFQVMLYKTVRQYAQNHIMLFCWPEIDSAADVQKAVDYVTAQGVDWSNASISFHGYGYQAKQMQAPCVEFLHAPGNKCALTCTEFIASTTGFHEPEKASTYTRMFETEMIGWCRFTWLMADDKDLAAYKQDCDAFGIVWHPDFGNWPNTDGIPDAMAITFKPVSGKSQVVAAQSDSHAVTVAIDSSAGLWGMFQVVNITPGQVALRSIGNFAYVALQPDGTAAASADQDGAQTFQWIWSNKKRHRFQLKTTDGKYLSVDSSGRLAAAVSADAGSTFEFAVRH